MTTNPLFPVDPKFYVKSEFEAKIWFQPTLYEYCQTSFILLSFATKRDFLNPYPKNERQHECGFVDNLSPNGLTVKIFKSFERIIMVKIYLIMLIKVKISISMVMRWINLESFREKSKTVKIKNRKSALEVIPSTL